MKITNRPVVSPQVDVSSRTHSAEPISDAVPGHAHSGCSAFECRPAPLVDLSGLPKAKPTVVPAQLSAGLKEQGWNAKQLGELDSMSRAVTETYGDYYRQNPTLIGNGSGTVANLWGTAKLDLSRGCREHQTMSYAAARGDQRPGAELEVKRVGIGHGAEHHAVVVFPKGSDWKKTGVVIDPWTKQSTKPEDFLRAFPEWKAEHKLSNALGAPRLEQQ